MPVISSEFVRNFIVYVKNTVIKIYKNTKHVFVLVVRNVYDTLVFSFVPSIKLRSNGK